MTTQVNIHSLPARYRLQLPFHRLSYYFVTHSSFSGAGHVTTNKYTDPVLGTAALTDLPINNLSPVPICPVLGHVATQVNIHRVPEPTILVVATVTFSPIFFTVTKSHRWSCDNLLAHTGVPIPLVTVALSQKGNF